MLQSSQYIRLLIIDRELRSGTSWEFNFYVSKRIIIFVFQFKYDALLVWIHIRVVSSVVLGKPMKKLKVGLVFESQGMLFS